ncbi:MAG: hypothetical protein GY757_15435, partial [bacterium]|nr:hypothetical protein [bacterium]
ETSYTATMVRSSTDREVGRAIIKEGRKITGAITNITESSDSIFYGHYENRNFTFNRIGSTTRSEELYRTRSFADDTVKEDETARIAVRSLLRRIEPDERDETKKWAVDFCHRSMREYFVARAICKMLENNLNEVWTFLKNYSLNTGTLYGRAFIP